MSISLCDNRLAIYHNSFALSISIINFTDVDECDNAQSCEHICINTNGSYYCKCNDGYELHNSMFCHGKT